MNTTPGQFIISLDFELYWGMFDRLSLEAYGHNILGARTAIPRMLSLFQEKDIHATWAIVGMLMARSKAELQSFLPPLELQPQYTDMHMSAFRHLTSGMVGDYEKTDPYHFGASLVELIKSTAHQEIGSHTFSHYYCLDGKNNSIEIFEADLDAHMKISAAHSVTTTSIIFPRNQIDARALTSCAARGITAYRGTEYHFLYASRPDHHSSRGLRGLRLLDHYINISGYNTHPLPHATKGVPVNVPSSRFLRPYTRTLALLEPLRMRRIKNAMTHAARRGELFHLWWHPHNFGIHQQENFDILEEILAHYLTLNERYGMQSVSMRESAVRATRESV